MAGTAEPACIRFGEFLLDPADARLIGPGGPVRIGNKAFRVLWTLVCMRGRLLTKEELFETVWDGTLVSESALTSVIKELRRALGDESKSPRFIESVYGRGYRFLAPVEDVPMTAGASSHERARSLGTRCARPGSARTRDRRWWLAALLALAAVVAASAWLLQRDRAGGARVRIEPLRIAGEDSTARLLSQNLANDLSRIAVVNDSTISFSDARDHALARADYILAGEVQRDRDAVHAAVRLTDGARQILWSRDFSAPVSEIASLRQQMAVRTGEVLVCAFGARSKRPKNIDRATLRLFLTGCENYNNDWPAARQTLLRVVERAPHFAQARGMYALALMWVLGSVPKEQWDGIKREAIAQARKALEDDPHIGSAYLALASVLPLTWAQVRERDAIMRRGIAADPVSAELRAEHCMILRSTGFGTEALAECERAVALDSLSSINAFYLAETYAFSGRMPEAFQLLDRAHQSWPGEPFTSYVRFEATARWGDARAALAMLDDPHGDFGYRPQFRELWRIFLHARIDPKKAGAVAGAIVESVSEAPTEGKVIAIHQLVQLNRLDEAYEIAMALPAINGFGRAWFEGFMAPFRADARFPRFVKQQGLTQVWSRLDRMPDFCTEPRLAIRCPESPAGWRTWAN